MPAGNTYEAIATQTVTGSSTVSVTFSSIPSTYTDLIIVTQYKSAANNYLIMRFNGDTGSNYSRTELTGNGSSATSSRFSNEASAYVSSLYAPTGDWETAISQINNYSNSTTNKTMLSRVNVPTQGVNATVNLWRSTSAINTILITAVGNGYDVGSTFSLYGIASA